MREAGREGGTNGQREEWFQTGSEGRLRQGGRKGWTEREIERDI